MLIPVSTATLPRSAARLCNTLVLLLALLIIPLITALYPLAQPARIPALPSAPAARAPAPSDAMAALPAQMRAHIFAQLGQNDPAARLHAAADGSIRAPAIGGLAATFDATTLRLGGAQPTWQWTLRGWGRDGALTAPPQSTALVQANQARYAQGGLESWYIAGPDRLEQGWTVKQRPAGAGPLLLAFAEAGRLRGEPTGDGQALDLRDGAGGSNLRYDGLLASDASGRTLPARFTRHGDGLAIAIDDRAARYPLTIDPWVQAATLTAPPGANQYLGNKVALSADGSTLAASDLTVIAIYTKPASGWATAITPLARLTITGATPNLGEGRPLALSADGSTLVAGPALTLADTVGAVDVYVRPAGGWASTSTPSATLSSPTGAAGENFGAAVALSPDGATVIVGASASPAGGTARGAAYLYTKPAGGWASTSTPAATFTNAASVDYDALGRAVALSSDGTAFRHHALRGRGLHPTSGRLGQHQHPLCHAHRRHTDIRHRVERRWQHVCLPHRQWRAALYQTRRRLGEHQHAQRDPDQCRWSSQRQFRAGHGAERRRQHIGGWHAWQQPRRDSLWRGGYLHQTGGWLGDQQHAQRHSHLCLRPFLGTVYNGRRPSRLCRGAEPRRQHADRGRTEQRPGQRKWWRGRTLQQAGGRLGEYQRSHRHVHLRRR
jgi:hypothetical protein